MKGNNKNVLRVKSFLYNLSSTELDSTKQAIEALPDILEILGNARFFKEAMPLLIKYSSFMNEKIVIDLLNQLSSMNFSLENETYLQNYLESLILFSEYPEFKITAKTEEIIQKTIRKYKNRRVIENLILQCYCSFSTKTKILGLKILKEQESEILLCNPVFILETYEKFFECENTEIQKKAFKYFVEILKTNSFESKKNFLRKWADYLLKHKEMFLKMYWIDFVIKYKDKEYLDKNIKTFLKPNNIYIKKHSFDLLDKILVLSDQKENFIDLYKDMLYSKEKDMIMIAVENLPTLVNNFNEKNDLKTIFNHLRNFIQTSEDELINYNVIYNLLKCSKYLSKADCIDFLLKSLLNFLQTEAEIVDEYFIMEIHKFIKIVSFETVKESLKPFLNSLLLRTSQNVY